MPTLPLIITDAGRQTIVDATNTGTLPVVLSQVALGTGTWSPDATATALQTELKRIDTVGGLAVADDTLHITITDDSADTYDLGEFGLYTNSGVLFAIYSTTTPITAKAADALLLLAADIILTSVPPGSVTVNGIGFSNPAATDTLAGIAEIATQAEVDTGTDDARFVTPLKAATRYQPKDTELTALSALVSAADQLPYFTGSGTAALTTLSSFARQLLDDTSGDGAQYTLKINQSTVNYSTPLSDGRFPVGFSRFYSDTGGSFTGSWMNCVTVKSSATRGFQIAVDHTNATIMAWRNTASDGLSWQPWQTLSSSTLATPSTLILRDSAGRAKVASPSANDDIARLDTVNNAVAGKQPLDATLTGLAAVTTAADKLIYATGSNLFATTTLTPFARTTLAANSGAAMFVAMGSYQSFGLNGYQLLPSGLIIQWGETASFAGGLDVTLPMAFRYNCLNIQLTPSEDWSDTSYDDNSTYWCAYPTSTSTIRLISRLWWGSGFIGRKMKWLAIGY